MPAWVIKLAQLVVAIISALGDKYGKKASSVSTLDTGAGDQSNHDKLVDYVRKRIHKNRDSS